MGPETPTIIRQMMTSATVYQATPMLKSFIDSGTDTVKLLNLYHNFLPPDGITSVEFGYPPEAQVAWVFLRYPMPNKRPRLVPTSLAQKELEGAANTLETYCYLGYLNTYQPQIRADVYLDKNGNVIPISGAGTNGKVGRFVMGPLPSTAFSKLSSTEQDRLIDAVQGEFYVALASFGALATDHADAINHTTLTDRDPHKDIRTMNADSTKPVIPKPSRFSDMRQRTEPNNPCRERRPTN